ncbi:unnamed protein product [Adineta steineri]|uniref:G-protein coupled receptors family 1 profile domain-containing protein n=1 Tax=Adineta steineri TaxID=433720 RepID=A0A819ERZ2_9BILA|nr:unnamed protein product [Adineta steineri]CAF3855636.1 unnamed protein product [Adineta steineri]
MSNTTVNNEIFNLQLASKMIYAYGALVLIAFGTVGNLLNILVFIRWKSLRQMSNSVFLLASFIGSLVQLWTVRFSLAVLNLTGIDLLKNSLFYCEIRWLFGRMSSSITMTSICLASIDRFLVTSRNVRYRYAFNMKRVRLMVIILTLIFLFPLIPDIVYYWTPNCTSPGAPYGYRQYTTYFNTILTNFIPVPVLVLFGILTWRNLHATRLVQNNRLEMQVNRMILAELIMVCFTSIPNIITTIYSLATITMVKSQLRTAQDNLWLNIFAILTISTYCGSFYVYCAVSSSYRKKIQTILYWKPENRIEPQVNVRQNNTMYRSRMVT